MIAGVLLAAGCSSRMGRDKLQLSFAGKPLYQHGLDLLEQSGCSPCIVVTNQAIITSMAQQRGFTAVPSPHAQSGMGYSVAAGAKAVPLDADGVLFCNADQPCLQPKTIQRLCQVFLQTHDIVVPWVQEMPKSPCIFPIRFLSELQALTGEQGGKQVMRKVPEAICRVPFSQADEFQDIDYPLDYAQLQKRQ